MVAVQTGNNLHFGRRKLEVEDADILVRVRIVVAAGNGDQPALHVPTQDNLCGRFTVPGGNLADCRVIEHAGNALSQRSLCFHLNTLAERIAHDIVLGHVRLDLDLIDDGTYACILQ